MASVDDITNFSADIQIEVLEDFVSDGRFAAEWVMTGTTSAAGNVDPVPFTIRAATVGQLDDADQVVRATDYWDMATLQSQLRAGSEDAGTGN